MVQVEEFFRSISRKEITEYKSYWEGVKPHSTEEKFLRWIFAFMSIHTTWESNVKGYEALKGFDGWIGQKDQLKKKIIDARVGLYNTRTEFIWRFTKEFWHTPLFFEQLPGEDWNTTRNRLVKYLKGIGMTKVSFTLEMLFPNECEVLCLDTHMMQFFGVPKGTKFEGPKGMTTYEDAESKWIKLCKEMEVPSYIARSIYWDRNQGKEDSRYWSYVLEK